MSSVTSWNWLYALLAVAGAPALCAQEPISLLSDSMTAMFDSRNLPVTWRPQPGCLASHDPQKMFRVPTFLWTSVDDTNNRLQLSQADEVSRDVAREIQKALGAPKGSVVDADSMLTWRSIPAILTVKAFADGSISRSARGPASDARATTLLLKAFDEARKNGTALIPWQNSAGSEPVRIAMWLGLPTIDSTGDWPVPAPDDRALTVFVLHGPVHSNSHLIRAGQVTYPRSNRKIEVEGDVFLRFVVDTNGNVVASTVRDVPVSPTPGSRAMWPVEYQDFVEAARGWFVGAKLTPEILGDCRFESVVEQKVSFRLNH
jgi:hypothetical protein